MAEMVGRRVKPAFGEYGTVTAWEPLGSGMTDTRVEQDDGKVCWWSSSDLRPVDGKGSLPTRQEAIDKAKREARSSLVAIRSQLVADWNKPWPGAEHGKAIIGKAIDGALEELGG
jgi:hypothetical protein